MAHACPNDFDVIEVKVTGTNGLGVPAHKGYSPSGGYSSNTVGG
jgi:hypothetical protein